MLKTTFVSTPLVFDLEFEGHAVGVASIVSVIKLRLPTHPARRAPSQTRVLIHPARTKERIKCGHRECEFSLSIAISPHEVPHWLYMSKFTRLRAVSSRQHGSCFRGCKISCGALNHRANEPTPASRPSGKM